MYLSYSVPIHRYVSFVFWFMRRVGERFEWITSSGFLFAFNTVDYFVIMAAVGFFCLWFFSCVFLFCRALHAACISYGFFVVAVMSEFTSFFATWSRCMRTEVVLPPSTNVLYCLLRNADSSSSATFRLRFLLQLTPPRPVIVMTLRLTAAMTTLRGTNSAGRGRMDGWRQERNQKFTFLLCTDWIGSSTYHFFFSF